MRDIQIEDEFRKCQKAMVNLADKGYYLKPSVDGVFLSGQVSEWRIRKQDDLYDDCDKLNELVRIVGDHL